MNLFDIATCIMEEKNIGILYHFTSYEGMNLIINDNFKLINKFGVPVKNNFYVSFTRNKNLKTVYREVRITIDGNKLSNRYQIKPYADIKSGYGKNKNDESEERALVKKKDGFVDISKSIIRIDVMNIKNLLVDDDDYTIPPSMSEYKILLKTLESINIPYSII